MTAASSNKQSTMNPRRTSLPRRDSVREGTSAASSWTNQAAAGGMAPREHGGGQNPSSATANSFNSGTSVPFAAQGGHGREIVAASTSSGINNNVHIDLFDYGTEIEFHDDKRREHNQETNQIRNKIKETKKTIQQEEQHEKQLGKDQDHCKRELVGLVQGVEQLNGYVKMHHDFVTKYKNDFESKIVMRLQKPDQPGQPGGPHPVTPDARANGSKGGPSATQGKSFGGLVMVQRNMKIRMLRKQLRVNIEKLSMGWDKLQEVKSEGKRTLHVMEQHAVVESWENSRDMVQRLREEDVAYKDEYERLLQVIAQSNDRIMGLKREIASKTKTFNKVDTAYEALVLEEKRRVKAFEAKREQMQEEKAVAAAKRDAIKSAVEKYTGVVQPKIQAYQAKKNRKKIREEEIKSREAELAKLKEKVAEETAALTKSRDAAVVRIQDTKGAIEALDKLCESYGDQEKDAKETLSQREQQKTKLLSMIEKVETNIENQRIGHEDELLALEEENGSTEVSIADLDSVIAATRAQRKELWDERGAEKRAMQEEIDGLKKRAENMRKVTDTNTASESLFRLAVLQEADEMVEEAQECGDIGFTL